MSDKIVGVPHADRRWVMAAGGVSLLAALAGCGSVAELEIGESGGDSNSAVGYLAAIRSSNGLPPLIADPTLERAALQQAGFMARRGRMAHTTGWGKDFVSRMRQNEVHGAAAENVAYGDMDLKELFSRWMGSSGHRRNMLDPAFSRFGLAHASQAGQSGRRYWALVLAS